MPLETARDRLRLARTGALLARTSEARLQLGDVSLDPLKRLNQLGVFLASVVLDVPRGDRRGEQGEEVDTDEHQHHADQLALNVLRLDVAVPHGGHRYDRPPDPIPETYGPPRPMKDRVLMFRSARGRAPAGIPEPGSGLPPQETGAGAPGIPSSARRRFASNVRHFAARAGAPLPPCPRSGLGRSCRKGRAPPRSHMPSSPLGQETNAARREFAWARSRGGFPQASFFHGQVTGGFAEA